MNKTNNPVFKKGFTLLELLVVIGIIAILIGVGVVSYSTAQKKARDAKRRSDLKAVQNCLEQSYTMTNSTYQPLTDLGSDITSTDVVNCGGGKTIQVQDPLNSGTNTYSVKTGSSTAYSVSVSLEASGTGITFNISSLQ